MKFFPAEASGGRDYLAAVAGPLPQLRFCPTGGITARSAADYLVMPSVACVGGSWLTPRSAVREGAWDVVEDLARTVVSPSAGRAGPR
jgi:2-dehydro-3-deoxyphosphogluconate aldolase/(4S)-4-hydroxy-2-oxoglutarate aldolase